MQHSTMNKHVSQGCGKAKANCMLLQNNVVSLGKPSVRRALYPIRCEELQTLEESLHPLAKC